jgi:hypothetical protein
MNTYKVAVEWAVFAEIDVQASSLEDAMSEMYVNDSLLPDEGSFVPNTFKVNRLVTQVINKNKIS